MKEGTDTDTVRAGAGLYRTRTSPFTSTVTLQGFICTKKNKDVDATVTSNI